jgi:Mannosyltransferase (PIG-V)
VITPPDTAPQGAPDAEAAPVAYGSRVVAAVLPPLVVWVCALLLQLLMLSWLATRPDWLPGVLTPWDNQWYVQIAQLGYPHGFSYDPSGQLTGNTLAFFPLYPAAIRLVAAVTGLGGQTASVVAAWLASAGAAVAVHRLGLRLYGRRTALALVALVFTQPMAVTLWIGYSESLFLLLAACCLLAVRREAWLTAGLCALLAGLTRSTGVALSAALAVAAVAAMWRARRVDARAVAGVVVGAVGVPAYLLWVGLRVGRLDAWLVIQRAGWHTAWDWGAATWQFLTSSLQRGDDWVPVSIALLLVVTVACCATELLARPWPPLVVYGLLVVVLTVGQTNYYHSKVRLLVPALLTLVPVARALATAAPRRAVPALAVLAFFGTWFGAYMLTNWQYAI